jgi:hypothetical protein
VGLAGVADPAAVEGPAGMEGAGSPFGCVGCIGGAAAGGGEQAARRVKQANQCFMIQLLQL